LWLGPRLAFHRQPGAAFLFRSKLAHRVINHKRIYGWCVEPASENVRRIMRRSKDPQPAIGAAVRQLRVKRGLTQETLAQEAGITVGHLSMIERGLANPTWGTVTAIAEALGVSVVEMAKVAQRLKSKGIT
jgi:DNA-binding XRE family transcriptional regulator